GQRQLFDAFIASCGEKKIEGAKEQAEHKGKYPEAQVKKKGKGDKEGADNEKAEKGSFYLGIF
ncbi:MAG: hypothetical protein IJX08_00420, partial [Clostridia bacterium]|nr:hypothetical protein [Clostridia bacterium]